LEDKAQKKREIGRSGTGAGKERWDHARGDLRRVFVLHQPPSGDWFDKKGGGRDRRGEVKGQKPALILGTHFSSPKEEKTLSKQGGGNTNSRKGRKEKTLSQGVRTSTNDRTLFKTLLIQCLATPQGRPKDPTPPRKKKGVDGPL